MRQAPNTQKTPVAYTITAPVGLDALIQDIQIHLATELTWLEKSYGRAFKMSRKRDDSEIVSLRFSTDVFFPAVWQGVSGSTPLDMLNAIMNDNLNSFSFFEADGLETPIDFEEGARETFEKEISLILWFDLSRIDPNANTFTDQSYPFVEPVKQSIIDALKTVRFTNTDNTISIVSITDNPTEIYEGYSIDIVASQNLTYPYHGFRFILNAVYSQSC